MNNLKNDYINIQNETEKYYKNIEPQMFEIKKKAFLNLYNQLKKMRENFNFIECPIEITFNITDKNDIEYEYHIKFNKNSIFIENIYIPGKIIFDNSMSDVYIKECLSDEKNQDLLFSIIVNFDEFTNQLDALLNRYINRIIQKNKNSYTAKMNEYKIYTEFNNKWENV